MTSATEGLVQAYSMHRLLTALPFVEEKAARQAAIKRRPATHLHLDGLHPEAGSEPWTVEKVHVVETVAAWLDSVGPLVGPNPQEANSIEEFVDQLRLLRAWAGNPTLRELEKRAETGKLPRSSISDMLRGTGRLPKLDLVAEFVKACRAEAALPAWIAAWHRLKRPRIAAGQQAT